MLGLHERRAGDRPGPSLSALDDRNVGPCAQGRISDVRSGQRHVTISTPFTRRARMNPETAISVTTVSPAAVGESS